jgi:hypothetical protein
MKRINWLATLGFALIALSALLYLVHYAIFRDAHHIFIYLLGDLAFLPIEVLLVTLIIHRLLTDQERRAMLKKLNMVIGAFLSEVGTNLIKACLSFDTHPEVIRDEMMVTTDWTDQQFSRAIKRSRDYDFKIDSRNGDLDGLRRFLVTKREFLLRLLENPNVLGHETFTELLWAVFHLTEELAFRADVTRLPESDYDHLCGDMKRAYGHLVFQWLAYMRHLRDDYPYLYSLAVRTNPFNPNASPEVT